MGVWKSIANAIYREYDRRIKRASLVTEYGVHHHADHAEDAHAEESHAEEAHDQEAHVADTHTTEEEEEAEIVNVPRGTPVAMGAPPADKPPAPTEPAEPAETTERPEL